MTFVVTRLYRQTNLRGYPGNGARLLPRNVAPPRYPECRPRYPGFVVLNWRVILLPAAGGPAGAQQDYILPPPLIPEPPYVATPPIIPEPQLPRVHARKHLTGAHSVAPVVRVTSV